MRIKTFLSILVTFLTLQLNARPARPGTHIFSQPDGSKFTATCIGDEFLKIIKTTDGHAIIRDEDGWWCYATYEADGSKTSSGIRIGSGAPTEILNRSMDIPYQLLNARAQELRSAGHSENALPFMQRVTDQARTGDSGPIQGRSLQAFQRGLRRHADQGTL